MMIMTLLESVGKEDELSGRIESLADEVSSSPSFGISTRIWLLGIYCGFSIPSTISH